jgi:hypothetical protein
MSSGVGGGKDGRSTGEAFLAGTGGARVATALGGGGDGRSTGGSGAKSSHRFFTMGTHAMEARAASCQFFFMKRETEQRFGTIAYVDMLHA